MTLTHAVQHKSQITSGEKNALNHKENILYYYIENLTEEIRFKATCLHKRRLPNCYDKI